MRSACRQARVASASRGQKKRGGADPCPRPRNENSWLARDRLALLPLQELPEQRLAFLRLRPPAALALVEELIEAAAGVGGSHDAAVAIEPFLRRLESRPAGQRRVECDLFPFRMERRRARGCGFF